MAHTKSSIRKMLATRAANRALKEQQQSTTVEVDTFDRGSLKVLESHTKALLHGVFKPHHEAEAIRVAREKKNQDLNELASFTALVILKVWRGLDQ